jgi:hypothetical protein
MPEEPYVEIHVTGGVAHIVTNRGCKVVIADYDVDGCEADRLCKDLNGDSCMVGTYPADTFTELSLIGEKYCRIRDDLAGQAVPIGSISIFWDGAEALPYRWIDIKQGDVTREQFQICFNGKWENAQSIDWSFDVE